MRLLFEKMPWHDVQPSVELLEAQTLMGNSLWKEAATDFFAEKRGMEATGGKIPMGIQKFINKLIDKRFKEAGWEGELGRFYKGNTWIRVTFRHIMSLDADILNALKLWKKENIECVALIAATASFLKLISPKDANSLCSYERFRIAALDLEGVLEPPLFIGKLEPHSTLDPEVKKAIL